VAKHLYGDWDKALGRLKNMNSLMAKNIRVATKENAIGLRDEIKRTIRDGRSEWPSLSGITVKVKGSSKPLIGHGDLMNSVTAQSLGSFGFFVGVPRAVKNSEGVEMVNIARVQEFGAKIKPKVAKALTIPATREAQVLAHRNRGVRNIPGLFRPKGTRVLARKGAKGFEVMFILMSQVEIPPRPFVGPTFEDNKDAMKKRWRRAAKDALQGRVYFG